MRCWKILRDKICRLFYTAYSYIFFSLRHFLNVYLLMKREVNNMGWIAFYILYHVTVVTISNQFNFKYQPYLSTKKSCYIAAAIQLHEYAFIDHHQQLEHCFLILNEIFAFKCRTGFGAILCDNHVWHWNLWWTFRVYIIIFITLKQLVQCIVWI